MPDVAVHKVTRLAAVDLGSNSFRLEIGSLDHGQIRRSEYLKETVRLGDGLDEERNLKPEAMQRGWDCLARFAERLAGFGRAQVRAAATQTLREARNRDAFLVRARQILGFPIDVISGREEARLIYQGVARLLPDSDERRLVVDIGGRSTELILGRAMESSAMESYRVGSVAWSMKYFPEGRFSHQAFQTAEIAAKAFLDEATDRFGQKHWDLAYGSSGTIGAASDILSAAGFEPGLVTRDGLGWLRSRLIDGQQADRVRLQGLKDERRAVIGGGLSVLLAVFDLFGIDEMHVAQGALRHGLLYDLLDRGDEQSDIRSDTVTRLARKFEVDQQQAARVSRVARQLLGMVAGGSEGDERIARKLDWAAQLHEVGNMVSHSDSHKHGAYILDNADALGFAMPELHRLSLLVLGHRGKLKKLQADFDDEDFARQLIALRLAVILCHARRDPDLNDVTLSREGWTWVVQCPAGWAARFPQSAHLLREESRAWDKLHWRLEARLAN
jgi:exopolyphosphatase/guanosine-5'-triphosphate,3'-diphosphate pyrophosphatase